MPITEGSKIQNPHRQLIFRAHNGWLPGAGQSRMRKTRQSLRAYMSIAIYRTTLSATIPTHQSRVSLQARQQSEAKHLLVDLIRLVDAVGKYIEFVHDLLLIHSEVSKKSNELHPW